MEMSFLLFSFEHLLMPRFRAAENTSGKILSAVSSEPVQRKSSLNCNEIS